MRLGLTESINPSILEDKINRSQSISRCCRGDSRTELAAERFSMEVKTGLPQDVREGSRILYNINSRFSPRGKGFWNRADSKSKSVTGDRFHCEVALSILALLQRGIANFNSRK
jgi:hypothetical protein